MKILITGASGRIGKSLGLRLLGAGHQVWGVATSPTGIPFTGYSICDVCNPLDLEGGLIGDLEKNNWSHLDAIILAAGHSGPQQLAMDIPMRDWAIPIRTCLEGSFYPISALFSLLKRGDSTSRKKIICFSGGGADRGREKFSSAAAAKAGLIRLVETLALEWEQEPIDINIVAPGSHRVPRKSLSPNSVLESTEFDNLYDMVSFLLSKESDGFTGKWVSAQIHQVEFLKKNLLNWMTDADEFTLRPKMPQLREKEPERSDLRSVLKRKINKFIFRKA